MIDRTHARPGVRQCRLLEVARSTAYDQPRSVSASDLALMRRIDARHLESPFVAGARMLRDLLRRDGHTIGRQRVRTLMAHMGIDARYRKPTTSQRHPAQPGYPSRRRDLVINRSNHVWAADITSIPMKRGFVYLWGGMDGASRRVLAGRLSNTRTTDFCIEAVQEAMPRSGTPDIFNTDQGSQVTSLAFTTLLNDNGVQISRDGNGCWRGNGFVERLWKSVTYAEVYLPAYESVSAARQGLEQYLTFYNQERPHRALEGHTLDEVDFNAGPALLTAG